MQTTALQILKRSYGYDSFRPGQWEIIENTLSGRDTVVLMPTGGGKSICYQIPALMSDDGCCVVVSPLISLMNDQVTALTANGIPAAAVNSLQPDAANLRAYDDAGSGRLKLLYISPERLLTDLESILENIKVSLFAIDEAHCISQWGHDFRPVYKELGRVKDRWPDVPMMALTATADRLTRLDIADCLGLKDPFVYIGSFNRPNLSLTVVNGAKKKERLQTIASLISKYPMDCGVVYCLSRKQTDAMFEALAKMDFKAGCYHAGMPAEERNKVQKEFVEGRLQVICATIAFGMGIDKSNIRWVVHNNLPGSIENYYQEIGRAGRDGLPAETILFYSYSDVITRRQFIEESSQKEINAQKLDLMQKYAEADVCRRRILLSYFSEEADYDCGNCDNCRHPKRKIDGTRYAQMALSAVVRVAEKEPVNVILEILRGLSSRNIVDKGYDRLPTHGIGRELPAPVWQAYILQMVQLGLLEIHYEDRLRLAVTPAGWKVLRGNMYVELAEYVAWGQCEAVASGMKTPRQIKAKVPKAEPTPEEKMTFELKKLRQTLAEKEGVADYLVLSDITIASLARLKPQNFEGLLEAEGLGIYKAGKYVAEILKALGKAMGKKGMPPKGYSPRVTLEMFRHGMSVKDIAAARGLMESTLTGHLLSMLEEGEKLDIWRIVSRSDYESAVEVSNRLAELKASLGDDIQSKTEYYAAYEHEMHILQSERGMDRNTYSSAIRLRKILEA